MGLYGITYKENVDDFRESPTLQLLEAQERHLARPLKCYDPFLKQDIVKNQFHDLDEFLNDVDMVVIMVKHDEIKQNWDKLKGKVILDCHNICPLEGYITSKNRTSDKRKQPHRWDAGSWFDTTGCYDE